MATLRDVALPAEGDPWFPWGGAANDDAKREAMAHIWLDSYQNSSGTRTDDQMLTDAMTNEAAYTQPRVIRLGARDHTFTTTGRNVYPGFALAGPSNAGLQATEQNTKAAKARALVNVGSGTSSMFSVTGGTIYNPITCYDISWRSTNNVSQWLHAPFGSANLYGATFGNLQFTQFLYCIGQPNNACTLTLSTFWGAWNIPNMTGTPISIRGSDNWFVADMMNIGWNAGPTGAYLVRFENCQKTIMRGMYLTCRVGTTRAILVDNQNANGYTQGSLFIKDCVIEGQNLSEPAAGALIYVNQHGVLNMSDCALNFAMANPTPFTPDDTAYIMGNLGASGLINVHDINVTRATGVSQNVPIISQTGGGRVYAERIFGMPGDSAGQAWTDLPAVTSSAGVMSIDHTLRAI